MASQEAGSAEVLSAESAAPAEIPKAPADIADHWRTKRITAQVKALSKDDFALRLREEVGCLLKGLDLQSTTLGQVRSKLEVNLGVEAGYLDEYKATIGELLQEQIQQMQEGQEEAEAGPEEAQTPEPKKKQLKRKRQAMKAALHLMRKCRRAEAAKVDAPPEADSTTVAGPLKVQIGGVEVEVPLKKLFSGRSGFHTFLPVTVEMEGKEVELSCMISCAINEPKEQAATEDHERTSLEEQEKQDGDSAQDAEMPQHETVEEMIAEVETAQMEEPQETQQEEERKDETQAECEVVSQRQEEPEMEQVQQEAPQKEDDDQASSD